MEKSNKLIVFTGLALILIIIASIIVAIILPPTTEISVLRDDEVSAVFHTNGGESINTIVVKSGDVLELPETPTKTGFEFLGWYTDDKVFEKEYLNISGLVSNIELYAKWVQVFSVTYITDYSTVEGYMLIHFDYKFEFDYNQGITSKNVEGVYLDAEYSLMVSKEKLQHFSDRMSLYVKLK